jgi:hypothetical protein
MYRVKILRNPYGVKCQGIGLNYRVGVAPVPHNINAGYIKPGQRIAHPGPACTAK